MNGNKLLQLLFMCHRLPERSFFIRGRQLPLCARCTGILIGYFCGGIYALLWGALPLPVTILLMVPLVIDGTGQYLGWWMSTNPRRLITGIMAGIATDFLVYYAVIFGFRQGVLLGQFLKQR